jgi:hypothetical protein
MKILDRSEIVWKRMLVALIYMSHLPFQLADGMLNLISYQVTLSGLIYTYL